MINFKKMLMKWILLEYARNILDIYSLSVDYECGSNQ